MSSLDSSTQARSVIEATPLQPELAIAVDKESLDRS